MNVTRFPLVFFVYKRPSHTRRTLEALAACRGAAETDLYVFADGPKSERDVPAVTEVRNLFQDVKGFRSLHLEFSEPNRGLAASVISGVGRILDLHGACLVVEDDLDLAPGFLDFLDEALVRYKDEPRVFSLSGYGPPRSRVLVEPSDSVWFAPRPCSWGWAIWKDRWDRVDWAISDRQRFLSDAGARARFEAGGRDLSYFLRLQLRGELDSWAVRLAWSQSLVDGLTLYPARSFVDNRGLDGSGTHSRNEGSQGIDLTEAPNSVRWSAPVDPPHRTLRRFRRHYEGTWLERWKVRLQKLQKKLRGWVP